MSEHTYHQHDDEIHIEVRDGNKLIEHSSIALVNTHRPNWPEHAEYIVRACNTFADVEEGVSMIVRKDHYYQLEAQAKSQPDLLAACEESWKLLKEVARMNIQPFPVMAVALNNQLRIIIAKAGE